MPSRDDILAEIRRTAEENGGRPLGQKRFAAETGVSEYYWRGRYWSTWGEAVAEAGYRPNQKQVSVHTDEELAWMMADLTAELGRFPTAADRRMKHHLDPLFPSPTTVDNRLGTRQQILRRLLDFAAGRPAYSTVTEVCAPLLSPDERPASAAGEPGYVYLIRMDRWHKVGATNDILRRQGEIRITLPAEETLVHTIETDDPFGVESYWHRRFAGRRTRGEWFELTAADVAAFRRWRRIY